MCAFVVPIALSKAITDAIRDDDPKKVHSLVSKTPSMLNGKLQDDCCPLELALMYRMSRCAQVLIELGCVINRWPTRGPNPKLQDPLAVHLAARNNDVVTLNMLLERGIDIEQRSKLDDDVTTALWYAQSHDAGDAYRLLLERGALITISEMRPEWIYKVLLINHKGRSLMWKRPDLQQMMSRCMAKTCVDCSKAFRNWSKDELKPEAKIPVASLLRLALFCIVEHDIQIMEQGLPAELLEKVQLLSYA